MKTLQINLETILNRSQRSEYGHLLEHCTNSAERERVVNKFLELAYLKAKQTDLVDFETLLNREQRREYRFLLLHSRTRADRDRVMANFKELAHIRLRAMGIIVK